jgi:hypothetical protein
MSRRAPSLLIIVAVIMIIITEQRTTLREWSSTTSSLSEGEVQGMSRLLILITADATTSAKTNTDLSFHSPSYATAFCGPPADCVEGLADKWLVRPCVRSRTENFTALLSIPVGPSSRYRHGASHRETSEKLKSVTALSISCQSGVTSRIVRRVPRSLVTHWSLRENAQTMNGRNCLNDWRARGEKLRTRCSTSSPNGTSTLSAIRILTEVLDRGGCEREAMVRGGQAEPSAISGKATTWPARAAPPILRPRARRQVTSWGLCPWPCGNRTS